MNWDIVSGKGLMLLEEHSHFVTVVQPIQNVESSYCDI